MFDLFLLFTHGTWTPFSNVSATAERKKQQSWFQNDGTDLGFCGRQRARWALSLHPRGSALCFPIRFSAAVGVMWKVGDPAQSHMKLPCCRAFLEIIDWMGSLNTWSECGLGYKWLYLHACRASLSLQSFPSATACWVSVALNYT